MKQPYNLGEIDEKEFNEKVKKMLKAIHNVKDIIVCDDTSVKCPKECPLIDICKSMNKVAMWGMLRNINYMKRKEE